MSSQDVLFITREAQRLAATLDTQTLFDHLIDAWEQAESDVPVRDDLRDYLRRLIRHLTELLVRNSAGTKITIGFIVSEVIRYFDSLGYHDIERWRWVIVFLVAILAQAMINEYESRGQSAAK